MVKKELNLDSAAENIKQYQKSIQFSSTSYKKTGRIPKVLLFVPM